MSLKTRFFALDNKLGLLSRETAAWRAECDGAASRFALHASQIKAVCTDLDAMHDRIADDIALKAGNIDQAGLERQERRILTALQIWDSYRAKWSLRAEPTLARILNSIDDLAWKAYVPALESAIRSESLPPDQGKLPPLVFPSSRWSPFARPREQGYELDEASGDWSVVEDFDDVLRCMPVPLIGIPWTQAAHLAEAVFVGHETGHLVEEDLSLQEVLGEAVRTALDPMAEPDAALKARRIEAWSEHWRSEVFADLWGLLCCGPAYASMLCEVLTDGETKDETQPDAYGHWSGYPPRALRLAVIAEGLRAMARPGKSFEAAAAKIDQRVATMPELPEALKPYAGDVGAVVEALLGTPLPAFGHAKGGARPAREVLPFSPAMQKQAEADATRALAGQAVTGNDIRVLFAGLALAFLQSPQGFRDREVQARFAARLDEFRTQGVRAGSALRAIADPKAAAKSTADAVFGWLDRKHASPTIPVAG